MGAAKNSSTGASGSPDGIRLRLALLLTALISVAFTAFTFQSCKSTTGQQDDSSETDEAENSEEDEDDEDRAYEADEQTGLKHPREANAWATRVLVSTTNDQPQDKIFECMEQIAAIAKDAGNQEVMRDAIVQTKTMVGQNLPLYHQCYYQIAARLDDRLAQGGVLLTAMANQFFDTMKAMWIMARALDAAAGGRRYFNYLRGRYIQISRDVFGRNVSPVALPFDEKVSPGGGLAQPQTKPAGPVNP